MPLKQGFALFPGLALATLPLDSVPSGPGSDSRLCSGRLWILALLFVPGVSID